MLGNATGNQRTLQKPGQTKRHLPILTTLCIAGLDFEISAAPLHDIYISAAPESSGLKDGILHTF